MSFLFYFLFDIIAKHEKRISDCWHQNSCISRMLTWLSQRNGGKDRTMNTRN